MTCKSVLAGDRASLGRRGNEKTTDVVLATISITNKFELRPSSNIVQHNVNSFRCQPHFTVSLVFSVMMSLAEGMSE